MIEAASGSYRRAASDLITGLVGGVPVGDRADTRRSWLMVRVRVRVRIRGSVKCEGAGGVLVPPSASGSAGICEGAAGRLDDQHRSR